MIPLAELVELLEQLDSILEAIDTQSERLQEDSLLRTETGNWQCSPSENAQPDHLVEEICHPRNK